LVIGFSTDAVEVEDTLIPTDPSEVCSIKVNHKNVVVKYHADLI
jgi:hypothetical protein